MNRPGPLAWLTQLSYTYLPTHTHTHTHTHTQNSNKKIFYTNLKEPAYLPQKITNFLHLSEKLLSQQILVPRTSRQRPPPTSPGRPLKILFDHPGDVPIWLRGDVLIWRSRDVPGRLFRDVPRKFSGHPLEDLQSTQTWMSQNFFWLFFQNLFDWPNLSKSISTLKVYWEPSQTSKMEHFLWN